MRPALIVVLAVLLAVGACRPGADEQSSSGAPDVSVDDVEGNVLAFRLLVATEEPAEISVHATGPGGHVVDVPPLHSASRSTEVPLVGLRADSEYRVEVTATAQGGGRATVSSSTLRTGALPDDLPRIETVTSDPERMSPGITLFNVITPFDPPPEDVAPGEEPDLGLLLAVDEEGEVVWYHRATHPLGDVEPIPGGLLVEVNDTIVREIDLLGRTRREFAGDIITEHFPTDQYGRTVASDTAVRVDTDSFHHEVSRLPSGNLLSLSTELRETPGFDAPRCGEDPADFDGAYQIISDVIVEVSPAGEVVSRWPIQDLLDPVDDPATQAMCRNPFPSAVPNWMYAPQGGVDWSHGNAVSLDEDRNALIVSFRHLDAVLAIRYTDDASGPAGEVLWRLGPGGDLELLEGDWIHHQHAPEVQDDGSILIYDNGNTRPGTDDDPASPDGPPVYSRAVLYDVDDEARTVRQLWEHRSEVRGASAYAFFLGDVDRLPNGHVLITDGGLTDSADVSAQLSEVVPRGADGGDVVWQIRLFDGHHVYRSERIDSLYEILLSGTLGR